MEQENLSELEEKINTSPLLTIMPKSVIVETEKNNERELLKQKINMSPVLIMPKRHAKELIQKHTDKKSHSASFTDNQAETETDKEELLLLKKFFDDVCLYAIKYFKGDEYKYVAYEAAIASLKGFRFTTHFVNKLLQNGVNLEKNIEEKLVLKSIFESDNLENHYKGFLNYIYTYVKLLVQTNKLAPEYDNIELIQYAVKNTIESYNFITYFYIAYEKEYLRMLHKDAMMKRRHQSITPQDQSNESIFTDENELCSDKKAPTSPLLSLENDENIDQDLDLIGDLFETVNDNLKPILKKIMTSELSLIMTNNEKLSEHLEYFKSKAYFDAEVYAYCIEQEKKLNKAEIARNIMGLQSDRDLTSEESKKYNNLQMRISRLNSAFLNRFQLALKLKHKIDIKLQENKKTRKSRRNEDNEDNALKDQEDKENNALKLKEDKENKDDK